ncbi:MAG: alpha/beta hydrolase [Candidatus Saccharimonadales bacterium]
MTEKNIIPNILILHGTHATPHSNWFMWLKGRLVGRGYNVWLPQLPSADKPNAITYTDFLLDNAPFQINDQTILIGHSSGAVEILHLLARLNKKTVVKGAILISAFKDDLGIDNLHDLFQVPFDFELIKHHCPHLIYIHSDNDPFSPIEHPEYLASRTNGELILFKDQGHFNTELDERYTQFPELLQFIDEIIEQQT